MSNTVCARMGDDNDKRNIYSRSLVQLGCFGRFFTTLKLSKRQCRQYYDSLLNEQKMTTVDVELRVANGLAYHHPMISWSLIG